MPRVQTPTFYFEMSQKSVRLLVFGWVFLGINDTELIDRYDVSRSQMRYLKN